MRLKDIAEKMGYSLRKIQLKNQKYKCLEYPKQAKELKQAI